MIVEITKIVPCIVALREILECLVKGSNSLEAEWEYIVYVLAFSLLEPIACKINILL